jgi:predicted dehydrogenase
MRAAAATGKAFWIAEQEQYAPAILTAQRLIADGAIGGTVTLHSMLANAGGPGMFGRNAVGRPPPAVGSSAEGNPLHTDSLGRDTVGQEQVVRSAGLPDYYMPLDGEGSHGR